ncbi:hypothetical protein FJY90_04140 [Candidatus Gottesmanbacteria bacterium]|nr:hypothetical protein [Candidatus Gottesmanbacteria bacterium]
MTWQITLFISIIFGTVRGYAYKKLVEKIDPFLINFYINILGLPLYVLYYVIDSGGRITLYPEMMVLGVFFLLAFSAYLYATKISLSQSAVYSSYYLVITIFLTSVFLGEGKLFDPRFFAGQKNIIGVILAVFSGYLIFASDSKKEKAKDEKWLGFMLFNIIVFGVGAFISKRFLLTHTVIEALFSQTIAILPVAFLINLAKGNSIIRAGKEHFFWLTANTIFDFMTIVLYYLTLKSGPAALVSPAFSMSLTVMIVIVGLVFFQEIKHFSKAKFAGLGLGILGVGLLVIQ